MMQIKKTILFICLATIETISAGPLRLLGTGRRITFHNATNQAMYATVYHMRKNVATRHMKIIPIPKNRVTSFEILAPRLFTSRFIFVSDTKEALTQKILNPTCSTNKIKPISVGIFKNNNIILTPQRKLIRVPGKNNKAVRDYFIQETIKSAPHSNKTAHVEQYINKATPQEKAFILERKKVAHKAIKKVLRKNIHATHIPSVSIGLSGGGVRAMLASFGLLTGLNKIGLLDSILYCGSVSGSCWALPYWLAEDKPLEPFVAQQKKRFQGVPSMKKLIVQSLTEYRSIKYMRSLFGFQTSIAHAFGVMLAKMFFKPFTDHYQELTLSGLAQNISPKNHPLPIMTAVSRINSKREMAYDWIEYSPYDIRLVKGDYCIPSWASMRNFEKGVSTTLMPELRLSSLMGIWGSAFSASFDEILVRLPETILKWLPDNIIRKLIKSSLMRKKRFTEQVPNFVYQFTENSTLKKQKRLSICDAGHSNNFPATPFTHAGREQDLLIIMNAGIEEKTNINSMIHFRQMLQRRFPLIKIDIDSALGQPISYWPSLDYATPNIIMISLHPNKLFNPSYNPRTSITDTKLQYSEDEVENLIGLISYTIEQNKKIFITAIEETLNKVKRGGHVADQHSLEESIHWYPTPVKWWSGQ